MLGVALTVRKEVESWNFLFDVSCMGCIDSAHGEPLLAARITTGLQ